MFAPVMVLCLINLRKERIDVPLLALLFRSVLLYHERADLSGT